MQTGNIVKTQSGKVGKVVSSSSVTVYVSIKGPGEVGYVQPFLRSQVEELSPDTQTDELPTSA